MKNSQTHTLERIIKTLRSTLPKGVRNAYIGSETDLQMLGMDSLNFLEFLLALEDEFNLKLTDDLLRLKAMSTVGDVLELVEHIKSRGSDVTT
ncbi:acyl carrier protein [Polynucleobacter sp.]|jgi:acyl carrier protein|uniref:acyl carrier protein n=1 Tax=Polynucleobacter sp. TaxID=2029855 RepID=UPI0037C72ABD